jgi:NTP pyrophosphatase (non-canonical NTP hydrolase)
VEHLRRQVGELKAHKGFDVTPEQRLAYPMSEVGEVAEEVFRLSQNGNADVGVVDSEGVAAVRERFEEEIYGVVRNLLDLADADLGGAFEKKARRNEGREW